ncbi:MAG: PspC domain-containing protein [Rhodocyclaceae bacterium]|nr:PspC domain-containing protein [Rhodocyclaceae bacterium]
MNWAEQLEKLQQLHQQGALTDEEYTAAKARVIRDLGPGPVPAAQAARAAIEQSQSAMQQLKRSLTDRWLGGVAGGLSQATNIPTWAWRILFILTAFLHGLGILMYVLLWIFVPLERPMAMVAAAPAAPGPTPPSGPPPVPPTS